jgi:hypothetical protein
MPNQRRSLNAAVTYFHGATAKSLTPVLSSALRTKPDDLASCMNAVMWRSAPGRSFGNATAMLVCWKAPSTMREPGVSSDALMLALFTACRRPSNYLRGASHALPKRGFWETAGLIFRLSDLKGLVGAPGLEPAA